MGASVTTGKQGGKQEEVNKHSAEKKTLVDSHYLQTEKSLARHKFPCIRNCAHNMHTRNCTQYVKACIEDKF